MATFNRVLAVLVFLVAVVAAVFSVLLSMRRQEFRDRADKMAAALSSIATTVDRDSQTSFADKVSYDPAVGEKPESGTLGWRSYHECYNPETKSYAKFDGYLTAAKNAVVDITEQRNSLAETLETVGITLAIDEGKATQADLKDLTESDKDELARQAMRDHAEAVAERDNAMIQTLLAGSRTLDVSGQVIERDFRFRKKQPSLEAEGVIIGKYEVEEPLQTFQEALTNLRRQSDTYGEALAGIQRSIDRYDWSFSRDEVQDKNGYQKALNVLNQDLAGVNGKLLELELTKAELAKTKEKLAQAEATIEEQKQTIADRDRRIGDLEHQLAVYKNRGGGGGPIGEDEILPTEIDPSVSGEIVLVNPKWGFVVVDLGRSKICSNIDMLVAREDGFVARVKITKVFEDMALGEILPEPAHKPVALGDRVILPMSHLLDLKADEDEPVAEPVAAPVDEVKEPEIPLLPI